MPEWLNTDKEYYDHQNSPPRHEEVDGDSPRLAGNTRSTVICDYSQPPATWEQAIKVAMDDCHPEGFK